jgi:hypothetical protein
MTKTPRPHAALTAGVLVWLTPEERQHLRQALFDRGGVSMQAFFRQVALAEIRAAQAAPARGSDDDTAA